MKGDGRIPGLILVPIGLSVLFSCARFIAESFNIPEDEEYHLVAEALEQKAFDTKKDRLSILPAWSLRPLTVLKKYPWISGDGLGERPLDRYQRLFLLVERDGEEALKPLLQRFSDPGIVMTSGALSLYEFQTGSAGVTYDFKDQLGSAEIFLSTDEGATVSCDRRLKNGFQCNGRQGWQRVTRERLLVSENGQDVIWAHPPTKGESLTVRYKEVLLGQEIVFRSGHTRSGATKAKAPVQIDIVINGEKVASIQRNPGFHFATEVIGLAGHAGAFGVVEFQIRTDNNSLNHFAFDAYTRNVTQ